MSARKTPAEYEAELDAKAAAMEKAKGFITASSDPQQGKPKFKPLTCKSITEIMAYVPDDNDLVLVNGYLVKRERLSLLGQGGLGKSRLSIQLAICCALGRDFLGTPTRGRGLIWLFLQTENGMRRLKTDLDHMRRAYSPAEWQTISEHIFFHTLETDEDGIILLDEQAHFQRAEELIMRVNADVIVVDPLRDFHSGDLSSDSEMTMATRNLTRLSKVGGRANRCLIVLHHALTGKAGAAKAMGYDRASFGRNSKVLQGWTRAQINVAPGDPNNGDVLVISSGKNNNFREFQPYAIELNPNTMTYSVKEEFDMEAWQSEMSGRKTSAEKCGADDVVEVLEKAGAPTEKKELIKRLNSKTHTGLQHIRAVLSSMVEEGIIIEKKEPRPGKPAAVFISLPDAEEDDE